VIVRCRIVKHALVRMRTIICGITSLSTLHPGDETGAGRHFIHALLAVLFIMFAVLVCTFVLEKRRGDTGEHPLDGMYQETMEFGHTVGNSISDMSTKVNP
jgi:hypothetical protein